MKENIDDLLKHLESGDFDSVLPEWAIQFLEHEIHALKKQIAIKVCLLPTGDFRTIHIGLDSTARHLMDKISTEFGDAILPPGSNAPLDKLFCYGRHNDLIGPLADLDATVWQMLRQHQCKRKFALEIVRAIKVNSTWNVASKDEMTPKEILAVFSMDHSQFTLYRPDSSEPLAFDVAIKVNRGDFFDAIKDGRYGG